MALKLVVTVSGRRLQRNQKVMEVYGGSVVNIRQFLGNVWEYWQDVPFTTLHRPSIHVGNPHVFFGFEDSQQR